MNKSIICNKGVQFFKNYFVLWTFDFYQIRKTKFCCCVVCMWESGETRGGGWGRTCVSQCINNKLKYNTKTKHITILQILHNTAQLHILTIFYVGIENIFVAWSIRRDAMEMFGENNCGIFYDGVDGE